VPGSDGDYGSYDVGQLWQMVETAKQTVGESHEQIRAWNVAHQMLDGHYEKLQSLRDQLEQLWPPADNPASAAYLGHLDNLLLAVNQTSVASKANADQAVLVTKAIDDAHAALTPLRDEYVRNEQKLADYKTQIDTIGTTATVVGGLGTGFLAKKGAELFTSPPVEDGRQDEINRLARGAMAPLSGAAQDADWNMIPPPEYDPPVIRQEHGPTTPIGGDTTGGATPPPNVAPPAHTRHESGGLAGLQPTSGADGPILSGGAPGPLPQPSNVITPPPPPPPPPPGGPPFIGGPGLVLPLPWPGDPGPPPNPNTLGVKGGGAKPPNLDTGRIAKALPPGGVLGGTPGEGIVGGGTGAGSRQVNPVGGLIGQNAAPGSSRATGEASGGSVARNSGGNAGQGFFGGQRGAARKGEREGRKWDPDNPWAVDHGVASVIEPAEEPDFRDPGPGIIGIDR
jgi:hypothetical protein